MTIDWEHFTPLNAAVGGLFIGLGAALYLLGAGRIAGIAGLVASPLHTLLQRGRWAPEGNRLAFLAGLLLAPSAWLLVAPLPAFRLDVGPGGLVLAGLLVGLGSRMGNGCTSGHGVCGLSRFSLRSLANVLVFMGAGMAMVFMLRHLA